MHANAFGDRFCCAADSGGCCIDQDCADIADGGGTPSGGPSIHFLMNAVGIIHRRKSGTRRMRNGIGINRQETLIRRYGLRRRRSGTDRGHSDLLEHNRAMRVRRRSTSRQ